MTIIESEVTREAVIKSYASYDCDKKGAQLPDFSEWNWDTADEIDKCLEAAGLKKGVLAGYTEWDFVSLTIEDLRDCAVVSTISGDGPRDLRGLEEAGKLENWEPSRSVDWMEKVKHGCPFSQNEPFNLRKATDGEHPAQWYLEDGSGRATAIVANASKFNKSAIVAYGYRGSKVDPDSTFMSTHRFL